LNLDVSTFFQLDSILMYTKHCGQIYFLLQTIGEYLQCIHRKISSDIILGNPRNVFMNYIRETYFIFQHYISILIVLFDDLQLKIKVS